MHFDKSCANYRHRALFVRSGIIIIRDNLFGYSGVYGYNWSSKGDSDLQYAYYLYFTGASISTSDYGARWVGFPLRCLAS